ncbi:MAG: phosphoribosyltransferase [Chroococcales cyanobacterium]
MLYEDRLQAGELLATEIAAGLEGVELATRVYGLPRGGIPVAFPVAQRLNCPLEVLAAKKIALPSNPELALGAITPDGTTVWTKSSFLNRKNPQELEKAREEAYQSAIALQEQFNPHCPRLAVENTIVIIVDDGIATGMTMMTAVKALGKQNPAQIWVAAPVAPPGMKEKFEQSRDAFGSVFDLRAIILQTPDPFFNVGRFYKKFSQISTAEAISYLQC